VSSDPRFILDTSVLLYFLLVGQDDLLRQLDGLLRVPTAVYDPEDRSLPEEAMSRSDLLSEMRQAIRHYEAAARSGAAPVALLGRVRRVDELFEIGQLEVVELVDEESSFAARLQSRDGVYEYGLKVPLGPGESACVAIASHRAWTVATDDEDALKVLDHLHGGRTYEYERIRKLLVRGVTEKRTTRARANEIHRQMRDLGFWDSGTPFP
jgi:hypothetical protein